MTKEQALAMLKAKRECIELDTKGNAELCDRNCGECKLNYEQGNMGEQKEALNMAIKALEQQSSDDVMAIHTQGLAEGIRCAMCTNSMKSNSGCDGGCIVDNAMYKKVMDTINNQMFSQPTSDDCVSLGVYKQVTWERDTAIEQLKELGYSFGEKIRTSDDCVSRQAILDGVKSMSNANPSYWITCDVVDREDLIDGIQSLPPVTPTQRWIPVSERLPKEGETVLVCYQSQGGVAQSVCEWFDMPNRGIVWSTLCGSTPIAWQPLPKPYKEKRGSENGSN